MGAWDGTVTQIGASSASAAVKRPNAPTLEIS
jgi:hypothetical protein